MDTRNLAEDQHRRRERSRQVRNRTREAALQRERQQRAREIQQLQQQNEQSPPEAPRTMAEENDGGGSEGSQASKEVDASKKVTAAVGIVNKCWKITLPDAPKADEESSGRQAREMLTWMNTAGKETQSTPPCCTAGTSACDVFAGRRDRRRCRAASGRSRARPFPPPSRPSCAERHRH